MPPSYHGHACRLSFTFLKINNRQFILFPYQVVAESATLIPFEQLHDKYKKAGDYLLLNKLRLTNRENGKFQDVNWHRFGRNQNLGIQERIKLCVPRLVERLHAAFDETASHFLDNVDVGGVTWKPQFANGSLAFLLAVFNSTVARWYFPHISAPFRGGFRSANKQFLAQLPIPEATSTQQNSIKLVVDYLLWLNRWPEVKSAKEPRDPLMLAFWEQIINALIYQLFFPAELAAAHLDLFRLVDEAELRPLDTFPSDHAARLLALRTAFERINATSHPLRAALFTLAGLDFVRLIEGRA